MKKAITPLTALPPTGMGAVDKAWDAVSVSFDRFCLTAGIEALGTMMEQDAEQGLRGSPCPQRWPARSSLGPNPGQDRTRPAPPRD
jgi:hypothetical protein